MNVDANKWMLGSASGTLLPFHAVTLSAHQPIPLQIFPRNSHFPVKSFPSKLLRDFNLHSLLFLNSSANPYIYAHWFSNFNLRWLISFILYFIFLISIFRARNFRNSHMAPPILSLVLPSETGRVLSIQSHTVQVFIFFLLFQFSF